MYTKQLKVNLQFFLIDITWYLSYLMTSPGVNDLVFDDSGERSNFRTQLHPTSGSLRSSIPCILGHSAPGFVKRLIGNVRLEDSHRPASVGLLHDVRPKLIDTLGSVVVPNFRREGSLTT